MNSKTYIPVIIVVLLVVGVAIFFNFSNNSETQTSSDSMTKENNEMMKEDSMENTEEDVMVKEDSMEKMEIEGDYVIREGQASYKARKGWITRPEQEVIGVTSQVKGAGDFNVETGEISLKVEVDLSNLNSGTPQRDSDLQGMLESNQATFVVENATVEGLEYNKEFDIELEGQTTLNNITKPLVFNVTGIVNEDGTFKATGNTTVDINEFGITPPSVAELYVVNENVEFRFDVSGSTKT